MSLERQLGQIQATVEEANRVVGRLEAETASLKQTTMELMMRVKDQEARSLESERFIQKMQKFTTDHGPVSASAKRDGDSDGEESSAKVWKSRLSLAKQLLTTIAIAAAAVASVLSLSKSMGTAQAQPAYSTQLSQEDLVKAFLEAQKKVADVAAPPSPTTLVPTTPDVKNPKARP